MQRRRLLTALAAGVPLAGCLGSGSESASTATAETTSTVDAGTTSTVDTGTTATTDAGTITTASVESLAVGESFEAADGRTVTVRTVTVRPSVLSWGTHVDPVALPDRQFVVADVAASSEDTATTSTPGYSESDDPREQFRVTLDGERYPKTDRIFHVVPRPEDADRVRIGFPVPAPAAVDRGAVVWMPTGDAPAARWELTADHRRALANPPAFEVRAFEIPGEVERGSSFEATLTVANTGASDGTFLAELGATTISDTPEIRIDVSAGETVTARQTVDPYYHEDADELTVVLNWGADRRQRTASVVDSNS